jgi:hypothetical protein
MQFVCEINYNKSRELESFSSILNEILRQIIYDEMQHYPLYSFEIYMELD